MPDEQTALDVWKEKLEYFQQQEAICADPDQKFALHKKIQEAMQHIFELQSDLEPTGEPWKRHPELQDSTSHLPQGGQHFVGREAELAMLDDAWLDAKTNIVEFVAFGGVGKSALVAKWLEANGRGRVPRCGTSVWAFVLQSGITRRRSGVGGLVS